MSTLLQGDLCRALLSADAKHGDVYVVSDDRRYFVAHRIVLISASDVIDRILGVTCDVCGDVDNENVVVFLEGFSGDVVKEFLSLIYTGTTCNIGSPQDETDLLRLCIDLKLRNVDSVIRTNEGFTLFKADAGFNEIESLRTEFPPVTSRFMNSPKRVAEPSCEPIDFDDSSYHFFDAAFKTEPEEFEDEDADENFFGQSVPRIVEAQPENGVQNQNEIRGNRSALFFKCLNCPREFHIRKRYENHLKECFPKFQEEEDAVMSEQELEPDTKGEVLESETNQEVTGRDLPVYRCKNCPRKFNRQKALEKHQQDCVPNSDDVKSDDDDDDEPLSNKRKLCLRPKVDFQYKEKRGRFYCMHPDCAGKNQSLAGLNGLQEHWLEKHAEDSDKNLQCNFCALKFASNSVRNKHEKSVHVYEFRCAECGKQFPKKSLLQAHMNVHSGDKQFKCDECDAEFVTRSGLVQHTNSHHSSVKKHTCDDCGKSFRFKMTLNKHKYQHLVEKETTNCEVIQDDEDQNESAKIDYLLREESGRFFCMHDDCKDNEDQSFQYREAVQEHWLAKHLTNDRKSFKCQYCAKKFPTAVLKNKHVKLKHELRFKCSRCEKKFATAQILASHIRTHTGGEKPFVCETCGADFKSKPTLLAHIRLYHSDVKNQKCDECGKKFRLKSTLRKHRLTHQMKHEENCEVVADAIEDKEEKSIMHPTPKVDYLMREENDRIFCMHEDCMEKQVSFRWKNGFQEHWLEKHIGEEDKIYPCNYCTKRFGSNSLRNRHIKFSHVLRFKCKLCEKKFATRQIFSSHMRTHTGEKPFVCEACGLSFSQKTYLRQHRELYHTDIKKFKCDECGEMFKVRATLKKHIMHHQVSNQIADYQVPQEVEHAESHKTYMKIPKVDMPMKVENGRYFCLSEDCVTKGQSFQWINGLREHFMDKHATEDQKCFPCRFCGKMFGTNGLKNKHENMYHELRFECTQCDKRFGKKTMLLDHMRTHTGEKPFVCETCGSDFFTKGSLNAHIRQRHVAPDATKEHHCDHCGKAFFMLCALSRHIKTVHTESRPFVCEECGKNYKVHAALKRHMEFHSGVTIPCEPCNLTFHCQSNYRRHIRRKHLKKDLQQISF